MSGINLLTHRYTYIYSYAHTHTHTLTHTITHTHTHTITHTHRVFLWSFHLPGEAQKIDRIMEIFAARYLECNPGGALDNTGMSDSVCDLLFKATGYKKNVCFSCIQKHIHTCTNIHTHTDTAYVLSYAVIMLHTSIYNPSVKDKPTVDRFVSMNRGINNGADLPRDFLIVNYIMTCVFSLYSIPFPPLFEDCVVHVHTELLKLFFSLALKFWLCNISSLPNAVLCSCITCPHIQLFAYLNTKT